VIVVKHVTRDLGKALRRAREERGLSLREASRRSQGRFTASGIAGYERGERRISVERMCALAEVYGVRPERLLAAALHPAGTEPVGPDLSALERLPLELRTLLAGYIEEVLTMRGPADPERISLRSGDLEILAGSATGSVEDLYRRMRDALADTDEGAEPQPASS
jgi:transcriptional regulator with XRE-family HTH domain